MVLKHVFFAASLKLLIKNLFSIVSLIRLAGSQKTPLSDYLPSGSSWEELYKAQSTSNHRCACSLFFFPGCCMDPLLRKDKAPSRFFSHLLTSSTRIRISTVGILELECLPKDRIHTCNGQEIMVWHDFLPVSDSVVLCLPGSTPTSPVCASSSQD